MLKHLVFAPCEKVILDVDQNVSLITLLSDIRVPAADVPLDAKAAMMWAIATLWVGDESDIGVEFEESVVLLAPDGDTKLVETLLPFRMGRGVQRNLTHIGGFPIGRAGLHHLILRYRQKGTTTDWPDVIARYPLLVVHEQKADPT